jgi:small subunit ribosomal protein S1
MPLKLKPLKKTPETETIDTPKIGESVKGEIVAQERSAVYLDLGIKGIGVIYGNEFYKSQHILKPLKIGDVVLAKITNMEDENGYRELSILAASKEIVWKHLKDLKEKGESVEVKVIKTNRGGLISEVKGISAFLPLSQLAPDHYPRIDSNDKAKTMAVLQKFINQILKVKIIDLDQKKERLILSEKTTVPAKTAKAPEKRDLKKYQIGDVVDGTITGLTSFGAFVGFGGDYEGLLYPLEISEKKDVKPEEVLKLGQKVKAKIIKIADEQICLSLKI